MFELDSLNQHHREFLDMIEELRHLMGNDGGELKADEVMELISHLNGQVMVHLTMEDRHVYPALMNSDDDHVREVASQFKSEIGGVFNAFQIYRLKWSHTGQVIDDPEGFSADTEKIFAILNVRMAKEDKLLYPLIPSLQIG